MALKVVDLVLKSVLAPHVNKTAYFDDILAQALNLLQVGVLFKYIKDQAEGLLKGEGLGGDSAGVFFVGGALAAIGPALFTAMYECVQKFFVLYRKLRVANAKVRDITNLANAADPAVMVKRKERALYQALKVGNKHVDPEPGARPNSVAGVQLTETEMSKYVQIMLKLLTETKEFDGKLVFKAAKQMKNQYLQSLNTAEPRSDMVMGGNMGQGRPNSYEIDNDTAIQCLLKALQTVMDDASYKGALERGGKNLLFGLLRPDLNLNVDLDLNAVVKGLDTENISRFLKVMEMCIAFDPEKGKEYIRKANMVLFELPSPKEYKNESLKNYVLGATDKPADQAPGISDEPVNTQKEEVWSVNVRT